MNPDSRTARVKAFAGLLAAALLTGAAPKPEFSLPKGVELLVPKTAVGVGWVLGPSKKAGAKGPDHFDVDAKGNPWIGFQGRSIAHALKSGVIVTDEPYKQFVWTADGLLLLTNGKSLGYLSGVTIKGRPERVMRAAFKKIIALPGSGFRLYSGAGRGGVFLAGHNAKTKRDEVLSLQVKDGAAEVRNLLSSESPVNCVAPAGGKVLVAIGRGVARLDPKTRKLEPVFADPTETVREVVHSPTAGYFYATATGLGFYTKGLQYRFMKGRDLKIRLRNNQLFVLLPDGQGMLRIDGLPQFAGLKPEKKAP